jgi:hypothetical protein
VANPQIPESGQYAKGDVLRHHSAPGVYHVIGHTAAGLIAVWHSATGERWEFTPVSLAENFSVVDRA